MIKVLQYVVGIVVVVLIFGRFYSTVAGLVLGIYFMLVVSTYSIGDLTLFPRSYLLAMDMVLIGGGLYTGAKEAGITRIWSYIAATVGVYLAITTIFGMLLKPAS